MNDRELASAARSALANVNRPELAANPLFEQNDRSLPLSTLRAAVLGALETLAPSDEAQAQRQRAGRTYAMLTRCDLHGEPHKSVIGSLGVSRRQFYRERRDALAALASAIRKAMGDVRRAGGRIELGRADHALIEALRSAGQYEAVWNEATQLASRASGEAREAKLWIVASEAARYLGQPVRAAEALQRAYGATGRWGRDGESAYGLLLWTAIGEMNLQWAAAEIDRARAAFDEAAQCGLDERTLYGDEAVLFCIMLAYAASIERDCGQWKRARSLLNRASRLAERAGSGCTNRFAIAGQSLGRLHAQLSLHADGDTGSAIEEHRLALDGDRTSGQLGTVGMSAGSYAAALGDAHSAQARPLAEFGLEVAERFYPGDRLARLTVELLPVLSSEGSARARVALAAARRAGLGLRDELFLDLGAAQLDVRDGKARQAMERADEVAERFAGRGLHAWACEARLTAAQACAALGQPARARRALAPVTEAASAATARTRVAAQRLGTFLAPRA